MPPCTALSHRASGLLAIDRLHGLGVVALARRGARRQEGIDLRKLVRAQADVHRTQVVVEVLDPFRAGDRHDVITLCQHPRQGKLARGAAFGRRELPDLVDQVEVPLEVLPLKARVSAADVIGRQVIN